MKTITYSGKDELSPAVVMPNGSHLILPKNRPCPVPDDWAARLLAAGPEFTDSAPKK